jgi:hypothetical protein
MLIRLAGECGRGANRLPEHIVRRPSRVARRHRRRALSDDRPPIGIARGVRTGATKGTHEQGGGPAGVGRALRHCAMPTIAQAIASSRVRVRGRWRVADVWVLVVTSLQAIDREPPASRRAGVAPTMKNSATLT